MFDNHIVQLSWHTGLNIWQECDRQEFIQAVRLLYKQIQFHFVLFFGFVPTTLLPLSPFNSYMLTRFSNKSIESRKTISDGSNYLSGHLLRLTMWVFILMRKYQKMGSR